MRLQLDPHTLERATESVSRENEVGNWRMLDVTRIGLYH